MHFLYNLVLQTVAETSDASEVYPLPEMDMANKPSTTTKVYSILLVSHTKYHYFYCVFLTSHDL